jgi:importin subunit alpha-1
MFSRTKQEQRKKDFKKGIDGDDSRRKREELCNDIRKAKREESLQKRRNLFQETINDVEQTTKELQPPSPQDLPKYVQNINSPIASVRLDAVVQIRRLLSIEKNPPIDDVIRSGAVPYLIQYLNINEPKLQFEAAWALTNIASGNSEQTQLLVREGAVPIFISLLASPDMDLKEQAVWALANIAGDSPQCRNYVLQMNILPGLLAILQDQTQSKLTMYRNAVWTISNLCRGKPKPPFEVVRTT